MGEKQPLTKQGIKGKKQNKTNRATRLRRAKLVGDVHIFVHKFVI